jgi:hypothetical protein
MKTGMLLLSSLVLTLACIAPAAADEPMPEATRSAEIRPPVIQSPVTPSAAPSDKSARESAVEQSPAAKPAEPSAEEIQRWIKQLDADEYWTREEASKRLARAGRGAVAPLAEAARCEKLEVSTRAIQALARFLELDDPSLELAAESALEEIAASRATSAAAHADSALDGYRGNRQERALARIRQLGATVMSSTLANGEIMLVRVTIAEGWRGVPADLAALRRVPSLHELSIYSQKIDDDGVKHLSTLKQLANLNLYGTGISDDGIARLKSALPATDIEWRKGALLGVHGDPNRLGGGGLVSAVRPGTAAHKAGLEPGDIIRKFDGKPVEDFIGLTNLIRTKGGGETVEIEFQRDTGGAEKETLKRKVTLDEWKAPVPSVSAEWEGEIIIPRR